MAAIVNFPTPGCIVEFLEDNMVQIALVLEESNGKLRLLLPSRRETKLSINRILPWSGPLYSASLSREEYIKLLETHKTTREEQANKIDIREVWEMAQSEISSTTAVWIAELFTNEPDADIISAYGRVLIDNKVYFRFQPPEFLIFNEETVNKKLEEQKIKAEKEALVTGGASFLRLLWDIATQKKPSPFTDQNNPESKAFLPDSKICERIYKILYNRMINPESQEDESLWNLLNKGLPSVPHLPLQLLTAWGKFPEHYNFWFDRADYDPSDAWQEDFISDINTLSDIGLFKKESDIKLTECTLPFISIDGPKTHDIDDAFHIKKIDGGWHITLALACPALAWPFGSNFDKKINRRGTSVYLPEKDSHMLPELLSINAYSLLADTWRAALCLDIDISENGEITNFKPFLAKIKIAANLIYSDVQSVLNSTSQNINEENPASIFKEQLIIASDFAKMHENLRISHGAIIIQKQEPEIHLLNENNEIKVDISLEESAEDAQLLIAELMVLASYTVAHWAEKQNLPLIHRTQNITLPREFSGKWSKPEDLAKIMHVMTPSILEITGKPHTALGVTRYVPITSPLRRYSDLVNEAQIISYISTGTPRWSESELGSILDILNAALETVSQIQKFRPRYWKLLYFKQQGDKKWWHSVITDENETFVNAYLPEQGIFVRGRRQLFDDRIWPGLDVSLRLGRVNPLYNEIQIMETMHEE